MRPLPYVVLLALACTPAASNPPPKEETIPTPPLHTPRWAFEPWISKDISTGDDTRAFVQGFQDRGIPVGVVVLDSPWETHYNTFVPNPSRYPEFPKMVADLRAKGVRTVLWVTQMVNTTGLDLEPGGDTYDGPSPNYEEGADKGYFVNGGEQYLWWKGQGSGVDFFHPDAVKWWHAQQDAVLDAGIAGWKLDFGEQYIKTRPIRTHAGEKTLQQYSEEYYRDYLAYGVHRRGPEEFLTMVRPYDRSYGFEGRFYARPEHAPVGWVGDNRRDWVGLEDALDHLFRSAKAGYVVIGSDIGGYLDRDDVDITQKVPFDTEVFLRWTALGALTPFMQLHGRANITPWTVPDRADVAVEAWKYWGTLHHELVPFFYSLAEEAHAGAPVILRPEGDEASWPHDFRFGVGDALFVAPLLDGSGKRAVKLPAGTFYDWWRPEEAAIAGGTTLESYDPGGPWRLPLFVREGAIVPTSGTSALTGTGALDTSDTTGLLVWPGTAESHFALHDEDGKTTAITASRSADGALVKLSRASRPFMLRVHIEGTDARVTVNGTALPEVNEVSDLAGPAGGYFVESARHAVSVRLPASAAAVEVRVR